MELQLSVGLVAKASFYPRTYIATDFDCSYDYVSLDIQEDCAKIWKSIDPSVEISLTSSVEEAVKMAQEIGNRGKGMQALVTGSTNLVGGTFPLIGSDPYFNA